MFVRTPEMQERFSKWIIYACNGMQCSPDATCALAFLTWEHARQLSLEALDVQRALSAPSTVIPPLRIPVQAEHVREAIRRIASNTGSTSTL